mmetsp:Transcript_36427/g.66732  ORF Transcript_36427/g.66732 Transcript_36427/m.66732 type:complete len:527 (-) Transcript_36427:21-1601(-)
MVEAVQAGQARPLQGYKRHIVSEFLADRYPYLEDINGHLRHDDVSTAFGARLFPRLVEQLTDPEMPAERLVEALRVVCDLCSHQENKCDAITSDVVSAATTLLTHEVVEVQREAARVVTSAALIMLGRSCLPVGNAQAATNQNGPLPPGPTLEALGHLLLNCDDETVKMNVAEAAMALSRFRDGCQQAVDQGLVQSIAKYLTGTLPELPPSRPLAVCLCSLLQTLGAVTMYASGGLRDVFGVDLLRRVICFLESLAGGKGIAAVNQSETTDIVRHSLRMLWHCGNDPIGRKELLKADGVRVITLYLPHEDSKVREAAVCALNVASLETFGKQEVLKHSIEPLGRLLHSQEETTYLHETCVQLCRCAAELPAFRFALARHLLGSIWLLERILGSASLSAVSPLLEPAEPEEVRVQATGVIAYFLKSPPAKGDVIRVPPLAPSSLIDTPALYALAECVSLLPNLLLLIPVAPDQVFECLVLLTEHSAPREALRSIIDDNRVPVPPDAVQEIQQLLNRELAGNQTSSTA